LIAFSSDLYWLLYKFIFSLDECLVSTKLLVLLQTFQRATEKAIKMQAGAQINI